MTTEVNEVRQPKYKYNPVLDIVRFLAALIIISIHIFPEGSTETNIGISQGVGVTIGLSFMYAFTNIAGPIFYVISSFILFNLLYISHYLRSYPNKNTLDF